MCCVHVHLQLLVQLLLFNAEKVEWGNSTAIWLLRAPSGPAAPPILAPPTLLVHVGSPTGAHQLRWLSSCPVSRSLAAVWPVAVRTGRSLITVSVIKRGKLDASYQTLDLRSFGVSAGQTNNVHWVETGLAVSSSPCFVAPPPFFFFKYASSFIKFYLSCPALFSEVLHISWLERVRAKIPKGVPLSVLWICSPCLLLVCLGSLLVFACYFYWEQDKMDRWV